jgi:L-alanine-DL-glutamate epimerase-like enolase superfamily enzyme
MKITNVRIRQLEGTMKYPGTFWEERLRMPNDIYPNFKKRGVEMMAQDPILLRDGLYKVKGQFLQIDTDEGVSGMAGPMFFKSTAFYICTQLRPFLIGQDPMATELLWDQMYRNAIHGRKGENMAAISYIDIALWDIKGKWLGQPVYKLLGGPVQEKIPAYASCLCYSIEPEEVRRRVKDLLQQGYTGCKWFVREGPQDGPDGVRKNIELVKTIREAGGQDMKIMIDAWNSWDVSFTMKMAELLSDYNPYWFEEPVMPDMVESSARLRSMCTVPIAGGEHEYTRWGAKMLMDAGALDIYQFDTTWAGGISELVKICTLASAYDVQVIPHGVSMQATEQVCFSQNAVIVPMMEYLIAEQERFQHFLKHQVKPIDGFIIPPDVAGVGIELNEDRIESEKDIDWAN